MTVPGRLVVDASVVVKWYVPETGTPAAAAILDSSGEKLAPDLLVAEFGNVLWKKTQRGELTAAEAIEIGEAFISACPVTLVTTLPLLRAALEIAVHWQRSVYDALYLALALAEGCPLVTADAHLAAALKGTELEQVVRLLGG